MDIFDLDRALVQDYQRFARSFTKIRAQDIRDQVEQVYASGRFWPEALISINPHFQRGDSLSKLVAEGTLLPETERVFRIDGEPITLFRHQSQAVAKAAARQSFAVTTGTGSGKSLCFFIPIIDSAIRARLSDRSFEQLRFDLRSSRKETALLPACEAAQDIRRHLPGAGRRPRIHVRRRVGIMKECRFETQERNDLGTNTRLHRPFAPVHEIRFEVEMDEAVPQWSWHREVDTPL